ncbi:TPA: hypothetical protein RZX56_001476 [Pseudomonas aeruginosa]|uniref:hypothetical protein n=1 Tax=Pseudomonas aeruginosa TaxID=287 RepID=UPI00053DA5F3|nr:hypothetical protein [Pseudomonas aeruginosa]MBG7459895.1 hypothetical protein [Pseudomonas aeruginosa]MDS1042561.1 hypothetical protein [Pseudomonas aeruginosa]HEB4011230.1 hypothetical protein [Pseudomonas aeruginosa]HEB4016476.1 hypothetical protein [Pseudomonas aeruginosa]HEB4024492.1 hypothetical protein [Pseudomonas aeruginosa]
MHEGLRLVLFSVLTSITAAFAVSPVVASEIPLKPLHFDDVPAMIEDAGDYSVEKGTFELLSSSPLKLRMSPQVFQADLPQHVAESVRRAALYGVYRTFIHTDADMVTVVSVPTQITLNPYTTKLQKRPELEISVTRDQALKAVGMLIDIDSLAALVESEKAGELQIDNWTESFEELYFPASGQQKFLEALKAAGAKVTFQ